MQNKKWSKISIRKFSVYKGLTQDEKVDVFVGKRETA